MTKNINEDKTLMILFFNSQNLKYSYKKEKKIDLKKSRCNSHPH
jgi:hypothetical protein